MFFSTAVVVFLAAVGGAFLLRGIDVSYLLIVYIHFEEFEIYDCPVRILYSGINENIKLPIPYSNGFHFFFILGSSFKWLFLFSGEDKWQVLGTWRWFFSNSLCLNVHCKGENTASYIQKCLYLPVAIKSAKMFRTI